MATTYSPFDVAIQDDPYPVYAWLRENDPVHRNDRDDIWVLSRHADVDAALRDARRFSSVNGLRIEPEFWGPDAERMFSFVAMDPPRHTRMRALVSAAFNHRRVLALEPRLREIARGHLRPLLERGSFDMMTEFAGPFPTDVISELVGVPESDRAMLRRLGMAVMYRPDDAGTATDAPPDAMQAIGALVGYYGELIAARSRDRRDDLVSALLDATEGTDRLTPEEIVGTLLLLVGAGIETTMLLLGNAWFAGAQAPDQRARVFAEGRVDDWISETLRFDPSTQAIARSTTEDVELHGTTVPAGARVLLLVGSANRDADVFDDPDRFDIDRDTGRSLSFGAGRHYCLGSHLGRLEARIALQEIVTAVADYEIDTGAAQRIRSSNNRGFLSLPTRATARSSAARATSTG
jgi:cytochrome P450